ncbi:MAG: methyltransferase domain-containing protein [Planctomycetota bacterium]
MAVLSPPEIDHGSPSMPGDSLPIERMPGHWLLAKMGKRVLRPGGIELTRWMLDNLAIAETDRVVELAPGLGATAKLAIQSQPTEYIGVERDPAAATQVHRYLRGNRDRIVRGDAGETGLPDQCADIVYGEAMLTMQSPQQKSKIASEAFRVLRPGGRYAIHELALQPNDLDESIKADILRDISAAIRVAARPLTQTEWEDVLRRAGFHIEEASCRLAPMHLLEPRRIIRDEGLLRAVRIACNVLRSPPARRRVVQMRRVFHRYRDHLCAISLIACKDRSVSS